MILFIRDNAKLDRCIVTFFIFIDNGIDEIIFLINYWNILVQEKKLL